MEESEAVGNQDWADEVQPEDAPVETSAAVKSEPGSNVEVRRSGGFARVDIQADARLRAIAEQVLRL